MKRFNMTLFIIASLLVYITSAVSISWACTSNGDSINAFAISCDETGEDGTDDTSEDSGGRQPSIDIEESDDDIDYGFEDEYEAIE